MVRWFPQFLSNGENMDGRQVKAYSRIFPDLPAQWTRSKFMHRSIARLLGTRCGASARAEGFLRVSAGFRNILWGVFSFCGFPWFLHGFCRVSAGFRGFHADFSICGRFSKVFAGFLRFPADLFERLAGFFFFSGNSETSSQQKLETEKSYHGHCAVLRQTWNICRDRFWSHKRWKISLPFWGGLHGNMNFLSQNLDLNSTHKARLYLATIGLEEHAATNCNFLRSQKKTWKNLSQKRMPSKSPFSGHQCQCDSVPSGRIVHRPTRIDTSMQSVDASCTASNNSRKLPVTVNLLRGFAFERRLCCCACRAVAGWRLGAPALLYMSLRSPFGSRHIGSNSLAKRVTLWGFCSRLGVGESP